MIKTALYRHWILGTSPRSAGTILALAVAALSAVVLPQSAPAQTFGILYSFKGFAQKDGSLPNGQLKRDAAGSLYGTTLKGGSTTTLGTVFELTATGSEMLLHTFTGLGGRNPYAGVIQDRAGNLYGTTLTGGTYGRGIVYMVSASGTETVLYSFNRKHMDGQYPGHGDLIRDRSGNLYGITIGGGAFGLGTMFKVTKGGNERVLHSFAGGTTDGAQPVAGLVRDSAGNLYGTTRYGGVANFGTVFKLTPSGTEAVLYSFAGAPNDGAQPFTGLTEDSSGNFYGTTLVGGASNFGAAFKLTLGGTETVLYSFAGAPIDGEGPAGALVRDSSGDLYGTTIGGGAFGLGTVFKLTRAGAETVLHSFAGGTTDGESPEGGLVRDGAGNLYGTTANGGTGVCPHTSGGCGTVFKITP